jgi:threonine aldolase
VTALRYDFASDNTAGAAPEAMQALIDANAGAASGYGSDAVTAEAADLVRGLLDADAEVRFVYSGTAANAISLAALARPFEAVVAHEHAHVVTDEASAPQAFGGGLALRTLPGPSAKIDPHWLDALLRQPEDARFQPPAALSLTQATEYGAVYTQVELARLVGLAKQNGVRVHLDGARLANAVAAGFDPKSLGKMGLDTLVVGGTKAGMSLTEALVVFDKGLQKRLDLRLRQSGQLASKGRFLSAPWIGMLKSGAWAARAAHANAMARRLAAAIPFPTTHPVEANLVFVAMDDAALTRLKAAGWAVYRGGDGSARLMCSWATTPELVDEFAAVLGSL